MKLLQCLFLSLLMSIAVAAHAVDSSVKVDLLTAKIATSLKNDHPDEALRYFAELESLAATLTKPLPESFYFNYIDTLNKAGEHDDALSRAEAYLEKYGKSGKHYDQVIEIVSELQIQAEKDEAAAADVALALFEAALAEEEADRAREEADRVKEAEAHDQLLSDLRACRDEAIAYTEQDEELDAESDRLDSRSTSLEIQRAFLDTRLNMINSFDGGTADYQYQVREDFNRDSQAFNEELHVLNKAKADYNAALDRNSARLDRIKDRCGELAVSQSDLEEVCGESSNWFCTSFN